MLLQITRFSVSISVSVSFIMMSPSALYNFISTRNFGGVFNEMVNI